uniref:Uncharacterized protein n=1 Tax=Grammatophora oceanica TaxID=210454 RepID=A0A6U5PCC4_9STRA
MKISCAALLLVFGTATAFTCTPPPASTRVRLFGTATAATPAASDSIEAHNEIFYQAVKKAQGGAGTLTSADLKEYDRMATELENVEGCSFEEELCDKEIQDRMDVAEILRLKIELHLRLDYLKNANLFADDVKKEHDAEERKRFKAELIANRDKSSSDSGLSLW